MFPAMPILVSAAEAKNRLSALLDRAENGEEITITRHGHPVARLGPVGRPDPKQPRRPGRWKGLVEIDDSLFLEPASEQDLKAAEGDLDEFMPPPGTAR